jgi:hypothetical protein
VLLLLSLRSVGDNNHHISEDTTIETGLKTFADFYSKKDYPNALLSLKRHQNEWSRDLWHFNMGLVEAQLQNWPMARFHLELAKDTGLNSEDLTQNLNLVEEKLQITQNEKAIDYKDYFFKTGLILSDGILTTLSLIFIVCGLWLLKKRASLGRFLFLVGFAALPLFLNAWIKSWPRKIVIQTQSIYEGPSSIFGVIGELPAGVIVLTDTKGEWEKVVYPTRFSGWIMSQSTKRLEKDEL